MTFDEAIKILGEGVFTDNVNFGDSTFVSKHEITNLDMIQIINDLRQEYTPTIEMTKKERVNFLNAKNSGKSFYELWGHYKLDSHNSLGNYSEEQLMQAWLNPETIKVIGELSEEEED